ncbi:DEAD/DEAH box helicase [Citrobacter freundii]
MVDFGKLRTQAKKAVPIEPGEIFRRLPKPEGFNDIYTSQEQVLENWFGRRSEADVVIKLHTGGGKTLVGLLMAQSTLNETKEPVLYLAPTRQLVKQTLEKAKAHGIAAVPYEKGKPLAEDFINGKAVMVATYKALFNGQSKFGVRGGARAPVKVGAVILDDAHVAFSVVRESFTLAVDADNNSECYKELTGLFRKAFRDSDRIGTFDDIVQGSSGGVIEVPYWAWHEQIDTVREYLRADADSYAFVWPLLRDNLHLCHALISRNSFTITPVLPLVNEFPSFSDSPRRIYMSATIADDSEIVRTFDADPRLVGNALTSRSLAGISERMILIPDLMPFSFATIDAVSTLLEWTAEKRNLGAAVLVQSNNAAKRWEKVATFATNSEEVDRLVRQLQDRETNGPVVLANRYDGIDLPGDSCRLLVIEGLPAGTTDYELMRAATLYGGASISRMLAQRIEQGIGRGARGSGDHCVVILAGADLAGWIAKDANFQLLTSATRAQLDIGSTVSREVKDTKELARTIATSFDRNPDWIEYHAETLAESLDQEQADPNRFEIAAAERKAFNLWVDGYHDKAITKLDSSINSVKSLDSQTRGWLLQLAGRIANHWGQTERGDELQQNAYGNNRNLLRPRVVPPYRPLATPSAQASLIAQQFKGYRIRRGLLNKFENVVAQLHQNSTANQFEQALVELAQMLGLTAERFDDGGQGPDVLWLLPQNVGFIIEAKSRKLKKNALTKENHGQLLVAEQWFNQNYPDYEAVRISVHPTNKATRSAAATDTYALTFEKLASLISDARALLTKLCESQLDDAELAAECARELKISPIRADNLVQNYLSQFVEE